MDKDEFDLSKNSVFRNIFSFIGTIWKRKLILFPLLCLGIAYGYYHESQKVETQACKVYFKSKYLGLKDTKVIIRNLNDQIQAGNTKVIGISFAPIYSVQIIENLFNYEWFFKLEELTMHYPEEVLRWVKLQESVSMEVEFLNTNDKEEALASIYQYLENHPYVEKRRGELEDEVLSKIELFSNALIVSDSSLTLEQLKIQAEILSLKSSLKELKNIEVMAVSPTIEKNNFQLSFIIRVGLAFVFGGMLLIALFWK